MNIRYGLVAMAFALASGGPAPLGAQDRRDPLGIWLPPGSAELPHAVEVLNEIRFEAQRPAAKR